MDHPHTFTGRLGDLSPFEITVAEASKNAALKLAAAWPKVPADEASLEEVYGCVDWYQYPGVRADESRKAS